LFFLFQLFLSQRQNIARFAPKMIVYFYFITRNSQ